MDADTPGPNRCVFSLCVALAVAAAARVWLPAWAAGQEPARPAEYTARVEVVARTVMIDVLDAKGRPVDRLPAGLVTVLEDGVRRQVLEVRPVAPPPGARASAVRSESTARVAERGSVAAESRVVVALDPETLGLREWRQATAELAGSAEALVALGAVDVVALSSPPRRLVTASRDATAVRRALALAGLEVAPADGFYARRYRFMREMQAMLDSVPPPRGDERAERQRKGAPPLGHHQQAVVKWLRVETMQLAEGEQALVRAAIGRLQDAVVTAGRPLVVVWAAGCDPMPGEFVDQLFPPGFPPDERLAVVETARSFSLMSELDEVWQAWAGDGVRVVSWSPARLEGIDHGSADARHAVPNNLLRPLAVEPLAIFQAAATTTGGVLVQHPSEIPAVLTSIRGRFEVTYQTDLTRPGWRTLHFEVAEPRWTVRAPLRVLVRAPQALPTPEPVEPVSLAVELAATAVPSEEPGREAVTLPVSFDVAPMAGRLGVEGDATFLLRLYAALPGGKVLTRDIDLTWPDLPAEGELSYEASLLVPAGASSFAVEVRERTSGAVGFAGPVEATRPRTPTDEQLITEAELRGYRASADVHIAEARFVSPEPGAPGPDQLRVLWKGIEQRVVRVAGGAGSSLELGIAIDVSESVLPVRDAFLNAATQAAERLLGTQDRVFRVDFGTRPRLVGAALGEPGLLFAAAPGGRPEKTAIFDALDFALRSFVGAADRAALIVFTDGCQTTGRTGWRDVEVLARARAVPLFVVMADADSCDDQAVIAVPERTAILSELTVGKGLSTTVSSVPAPARKNLTAELNGADPRFWLSRLAVESGGGRYSLKRAARAGDVWAEVENALARLWVAVFEPSDPALDRNQVEVRLGRRPILRPGS